jgi:hypothetical protein
MTLRDHPQRITPPAAPGAMLKSGFGPIARPRLVETERDEAYLKLVRQCPCLRCGLDPCGEAHHVLMSSGAHNKHRAKGKLPADCWALPFDRACHQNDRDSIHRIGEIAFFQFLGIAPLLVCERLYAKRGDLVAMRAVIFCAIAERESAEQMRGSGR